MKNVIYKYRNQTYLCLPLLLSLMLLACKTNLNEPESKYHIKVTVDTNIDSARIGNTYLKSTDDYPYTIFEETGADGTTKIMTVYPVKDTGLISLKLYGAVGINLPSLAIKDSLRLHTPIDTTNFFIDIELNGKGSLKIQNN